MMMPLQIAENLNSYCEQMALLHRQRIAKDPSLQNVDAQQDGPDLLETRVSYPDSSILPEPLGRVAVNPLLYGELAGQVYADRAGNLYVALRMNGEPVPALTPFTKDRVFALAEPAYDPDVAEFVSHQPSLFSCLHRQEILRAVELAKRDCEVGYDD